MSTLFITHNDMDGIAAHIINKCLKLHFDKEISISLTADIDNYLDEYDEITFVDLVPITEEKYNELIENGKKIRIYDHHTTNEWIKKYPNTWFDNTICGAKVYYNAIKVKSIPLLGRYIDVVSAYDTWDTNCPFFRHLSVNYNRVFTSLSKINFNVTDLSKPNGYTEYIELIVDKISNNNEKFTEKETEIIEFCKQHEKKEYGYMKHNTKFYVDKHGVKYGCIPMVCFTDFVVHEILELLSDKMEYIVICKEKRGNISVRSINFDITTLDYVNGHKHAGGAKLDKDIIKQLINGEISL